MALLQASQETTLTFANLNFDFSMIKYEAPKEYEGLDNSLSKRRKEAAEDGHSHVTARKLSALFQSAIPDIPNLIQAYGRRVSEIATFPSVNPKGNRNQGAFADHVIFVVLGSVLSTWNVFDMPLDTCLGLIQKLAGQTGPQYGLPQHRANVLSQCIC